MNTSKLLLLVLAWLPAATGLAQSSSNFGPNIQYPQPPANPVVQSIHPPR